MGCCMRSVSGTLGIALVTALALGGCGAKDKQPELMNLRSSTSGPDEFGILPTKPLAMPDSLTELPAPTPGGANITDPTPQADAVAALGGNPERVTGTGKSTGVMRPLVEFGADTDQLPPVAAS